MKYQKISRQDSMVITVDDINVSKLGKFFIEYPERLVFVVDNNDRITGIITRDKFEKNRNSGVIVKEFSFVRFQMDYLNLIEDFFNNKNYRWLPVLDNENRLIEYYIRVREPFYDVEKMMQKSNWLNVSTNYLAKLVQLKGYRKLKILVNNAVGKKAYLYFKHYEKFFQNVEKIQLSEVESINDEECLIWSYEETSLLEIKEPVLYLYELCAELDFFLLLYKCKKKNMKIYLSTCPNFDNVWNLTEEEKKRKHMHWNRFVENYDMYENLLKEVLIDIDDLEYFIETYENIPNTILKDGIYCMNDYTGKYVNVVNGCRITLDSQEEKKNRVHVAGNSFVFGPIVDDAHTLTSILQKKINQSEKFKSYHVENDGLRGMPDWESIKRLNNKIYENGDIIILIAYNSLLTELQKFSNLNIYHIEDVYNNLDRNVVKKYYIDTPGHPNSVGYELAADFLYNMLESESEVEWQNPIFKDEVEIEKRHLASYSEDKEFSAYLQELKKISINGENGAIVMNCNPLTKGHAYLIDYAASRVENLYIFVVQEDCSSFSFEERYKMVCDYSKKHSNVKVLPSSSYVGSMGTFPGYFITKKIESFNKGDSSVSVDASLDLHLFGKYIAHALNIKTRFVGEEPIDRITAQYNRDMKYVLPHYGVCVKEIPRYEESNIGILSASKVRQAISNGDWELVGELVPETTYNILFDKYVDFL